MGQSISIIQTFNMRFIIALAFLAAVATPAVNTCEEKNDMLKNALVRLAKKNMAKEDCSTCFDDILAAVVDCFFSGSWLQCVEDVLGAGNPCINCVCEVITEVCAVVG